MDSPRNITNETGRVLPHKLKNFFSHQKPYSGAGSDKWTESTPYPGWAVFVIVMIVLASTLPILIWIIKDWPKNWRTSFHKMFCTGLNNYLPDPKKEDEPEASYKGTSNYGVEGGHV